MALKNIIHEITKTDPKRWFVIYDNNSGELGFILFGYVGAINEFELATGQPNILSFLTENEIEDYLDDIAGEGYYKDSVETESDKFQGPSEKYYEIS
tara:strand:+ start:1270 stop:1560 length:291 start_codon:yes stop_codon:yes gene_type:complete